MGDGLVSWGNGQPHFKETTGSLLLCFCYFYTELFIVNRGQRRDTFQYCLTSFTFYYDPE